MKSRDAGGLDVAAVGDCGVDMYARVPRLAGYDEKVPGNFLGMFGGGVAANFACAAAKLGLRAGLVSVVGDDDLGRRAVESVDAFGVDTTGVRVKTGTPTHFCFVCLDERGEKALTIVRTDVFAPRWSDVSLPILSSSRLVHVAPFDLETALRVAAHAASVAIPVSVDLEPGSAGEGMHAVKPLIESATILMPNQQCIDVLFDGLGVEDAAAQLLDLGPEVVVVTRGEQGSFVATAESQAAMPAFPVRAVDTTGAGDCFNAAFISRWLAGRPAVECAEFASAAAALSTLAVGAREGLPTAARVAEFLEQQHAGRGQTGDRFSQAVER